MLDVQRRELKYLVNTPEMMGIKQQLSQIMESDSHNGATGYRVRSLYFDTMSDSDFEEKVDGYDKRQKIRIRVYDTQFQNIKLELKVKQLDMQRKYSLLLSREEAESMMQKDYSFLMERPEPIAQAIYTKMVTNCYRPKCIVEYNRLAFIRGTNDTRVTFDQNLRATESNLNLLEENLVLYPICNPGETTMEVKYNGFLFSYIKQVISNIDKQHVSNSKYCRARMVSKKGRY